MDPNGLMPLIHNGSIGFYVLFIVKNRKADCTILAITRQQKPHENYRKTSVYIALVHNYPHASNHFGFYSSVFKVTSSEALGVVQILPPFP